MSCHSFLGITVSKYCIKIPTLQKGGWGVVSNQLLPKPLNKGSHTKMLVIVISPHQCAYSGQFLFFQFSLPVKGCLFWENGAMHSENPIFRAPSRIVIQGKNLMHKRCSTSPCSSHWASYYKKCCKLACFFLRKLSQCESVWAQAFQESVEIVPLQMTLHNQRQSCSLCTLQGFLCSDPLHWLLNKRQLQNLCCKLFFTVMESTTQATFDEVLYI